MKLQELLSDKNPAVWEKAYNDLVVNGKTSEEEWLLEWLWHRIQWNEEGFSLFALGNKPIQAHLMGVHLVVEVGDNQKKRYITLKIFKSTPFQPDFQEQVQVGDKEWRFPSIGNPYLDEPLYKIWEKWLFCKLLNIALEEKGGLVFLIEKLHHN